MVATNRSSGGASSRDDTSTQEQRDLVFKIRKTRNYYDILGLQRSASDEEIKRAYRKLALKLHPDKCTAVGSDEAFKLVSRAFSCLSDGTKRAAYDRYGEETPGLSRAQNGGGPAGGVPFGLNDDFDPEQLFNMFFNGGFGGGGFGGPRGPVFRAHFGGGPGGGFRRHAGPAPAQQQAANPAAQLLHFLPILFLLLFTFLQMPSQPVYSLDKAGEYRHQVDTQRLGVPYFVRSVAALDKSHPPGSRDRGRLEAEVEVLHKERLEQRCYSERLNQQTLFRWGQAERAKAYQLPHCEALKTMYGATRVY